MIITDKKRLNSGAEESDKLIGRNVTRYIKSALVKYFYIYTPKI